MDAFSRHRNLAPENRFCKHITVLRRIHDCITVTIKEQDITGCAPEVLARSRPTYWMIFFSPRSWDIRNDDGIAALLPSARSAAPNSTFHRLDNALPLPVSYNDCRYYILQVKSAQVSRVRFFSLRLINSEGYY